MTYISWASILAIFIPPILLLVAIITNNRSLKDREKSSPFECGFDPTHTARIPFSMRFFLLAVIFIVFDIEIVLLIPTPLLMMHYNLSILFTAISSFIIILFIGLLHEWNEGSLNWSN